MSDPMNPATWQDEHPEGQPHDMEPHDVLRPGHTYASVSDKISSLVLVRPYNWRWITGPNAWVLKQSSVFASAEVRVSMSNSSEKTSALFIGGLFVVQQKVGLYK